MLTEQQLVQACIKQDRKAQYGLYERFAGKLYAVALRYIKDRDEAQDVLQEAFIRIFNKLDTFRFDAPLEAWLKRVVINTALRALKTKRNFEDLGVLDFDVKGDYLSYNEGINNLEKEQMETLLDSLPSGCKTIFMLYAIEGFKHQEIADMLNINEGTSKSQYARAKSLLALKLDSKNVKTGS